MIDYVEKFWSQVEKRGNCWFWTGTLTEKGYGSFYAVQDGVKFYRAHRFSWHIHNGPIDDDLFVLHTCDNPWCVNPDHLWLGDNDANMQDKIDKGRHKPGAKHGMAKLTEDDVRYIKSCGKSGSELAREFGVHNSTIYNIRNGKSWRHLLPDYEPKPRWKPSVQTGQES